MLNSIKGWRAERNDLVHHLVTLDKHPDSKQKFKSLAPRSKLLVNFAYKTAGKIRGRYYKSESIPPIPDECAHKCRCKKNRCVYIPDINELI